MIIDEIISAVMRKKLDAVKLCERAPKITIYIEDSLWFQMMAETPLPYFRASSDPQGEHIHGYPVFRVFTEGHGVKIFTEPEDK